MSRTETLIKLGWLAEVVLLQCHGVPSDRECSMAQEEDEDRSGLIEMDELLAL